MTRDQADTLIIWLADGFAHLREFIDSQVSTSATQPAPKRRGRPRKANAPIPDTGYGTAKKEEVKEDAPKDETLQGCPYCGRGFPARVITIHKENCALAAAGYGTHIAQPGKRD